MDSTLFVHIGAGTISLIAGYMALYSAKGRRLHRRSGSLFVYAMLVMTLVGAVMAATRGRAPTLNVPAALLTAYLVVTSLTTVRPEGKWSHWCNRVAVIVAFGISLFTLDIGINEMASGNKRNSMQALPYLMFGVVALVAGVGDVQLLRAGRVVGTPRLVRHLWRMCVALLFAAMSFFFGQADVIPSVLRQSGLLSLPVLAVFVTMLFWLWRVRRQRATRHLVEMSDSIRELT